MLDLTQHVRMHLTNFADAFVDRVRGADREDLRIRVTLINQDPAAAHDVQVQIPNSTTPGNLETLTAPSISSTDGVALPTRPVAPSRFPSEAEWIRAIQLRLNVNPARLRCDQGDAR